ncbi:hypothetical protein CRU99_13095 [Malaciobacter mytili]|uniref:hypothetical protein n=1 Tax=Malaciobacter mytili TaxID=603050 RepID=UPI00100BEBED|nr:hypothetical protein [Malaciobacter mytili]RXI36937.1 hypothetical protein CRU99_13095 [Malaciobacter mytili]
MFRLIFIIAIGLSCLSFADTKPSTSTSTSTGTNDFKEFNEVVSNADASAKTTIGVFAKWIIGLLPILGLTIGIFGGMKYLRKQSNGQEENFAKELGYGGVGAFIGLLVSILFITAIGAGLMGNSSSAFTVLNQFWKGILGVS